jgi:hypothetical protein
LPIASTTSPTSPGSLAGQLGALADQRRLSAPRMISGQFPDQILDPAIRELNTNLLCIADHVPIRDDVPAPVDHDSRAERAAAQRDARRRVRRRERAFRVDRRDRGRADGHRVRVARDGAVRGVEPCSRGRDE